MGRLDELDLSLRLSKREEAQVLAVAQERLVVLRLVLGGKLGSGQIWSTCVVLCVVLDATGNGS